MSGSKKIIFYTVNSQSIFWQFETIMASFWLLKKETSPYIVEIILLDDPNVSNLRNRIKIYIKLIYINLNENLKTFIKKNIFKILLSKKTIIKLLLYLDSPFEKKSIHNKLALGQKITFKHNNIEFIIKQEKFLNFFFNCLVKIKAYLISFFIFFYYKILMTPKKFLNLKFKSILIGDIIASTFLRKNPKSAGSFKLSLSLYTLLNKAIYYHLKSKYILDYSSKYKAYIILPEPTYLQVFWKRLFIKHGVVSIETHSYKNKFYINKDANLQNPWIAKKQNIQKITVNQKKDVDDFFYTRFNNPEKIMAYLTKDNSNKNNENEIYDINNNVIDFENCENNGCKELVAIIFLHSFDDAQYCFGIDDFTDLYEWTIYSIETCLSNKKFDKILIKPHPGLDYDVFPGDKIAFDKIYKKYSNFKKIKFIKKDSSILYLAHVTNIVGITHHGSIAEELIYLNQNAIGYVGGMWSDHYKFLSTWKSKKQYANIIHSFDKDNINKPSKIEIEYLYNYILERKLNSIDLRKYSIRLRLSKNIDEFKHWNFTTYNEEWIRFNNDIALLCNNNLFKNKIVPNLHALAHTIG